MPDADAVIEHLFPTLADVREKDANALEVAGPMSAEYHGETITVCNHVMGWVHGTFLFNFLLNAGLSVNITMTMLDMLIIHTLNEMASLSTPRHLKTSMDPLEANPTNRGP